MSKSVAKKKKESNGFSAREVESRFAGYEKDPVMTDIKELVIQAMAEKPVAERTGFPGLTRELHPSDLPKTHVVTNTRIRDVVENVSHLFTLPNHVMHITQMIQSHSATVEDVCVEIAKDPSLSAEILRIVNSSFYGLQQQISSIRHAVVILGFNVIHALVLSTSVVNLTSIKQLWQHSAICTKACTLLGQKARIRRAEELGVIGLLHDIGKVVLEEYASEKSTGIHELAERERIPLYDAERMLLGCTHAELGQWLLDKWNLPPETSFPIGNHHNLDLESPHLASTAVVHMADVLVNAVCPNMDSMTAMPKLHPKTLQILKIGIEDLRDVISKVITFCNPDTQAT